MRARHKPWQYSKNTRGAGNEAQRPRLSDNQMAAVKGRRVTDTDELAVLLAKIARYVRDGTCRVTWDNEPSAPVD